MKTLYIEHMGKFTPLDSILDTELDFQFQVRGELNRIKAEPGYFQKRSELKKSLEKSCKQVRLYHKMKDTLS